MSDRLIVRPARRADVPAVVGMVHELANFERAAEECTLTERQLEAALFAEQPAVFGHVAVYGDELTHSVPDELARSGRGTVPSVAGTS